MTLYSQYQAQWTSKDNSPQGPQGLCPVTIVSCRISLPCRVIRFKTRALKLYATWCNLLSMHALQLVAVHIQQVITSGWCHLPFDAMTLWILHYFKVKIIKVDCTWVPRFNMFVVNCANNPWLEVAFKLHIWMPPSHAQSHKSLCQSKLHTCCVISREIMGYFKHKSTLWCATSNANVSKQLGHRQTNMHIWDCYSEGLEQTYIKYST